MRVKAQTNFLFEGKMVQTGEVINVNKEQMEKLREKNCIKTKVPETVNRMMTTKNNK